MEKLAGISEKNRRYITILHRHSNGIVRVKEAAKLLGWTRSELRKRLQHWLTRGGLDACVEEFIY